ncbi:MAG: hypothetical protein EP314_08370 [Bacteroidetes bacterium]|nr:MAG: hypothetical protein EP314_08370 [Bacteroidota bacterium]
MNRFLLHNGVLLNEADKLVEATNRSFRYGDGFFESMRMFNGQLPFVHLHWMRLQRAAAYLQIPLAEGLNAQSFEHYAIQLGAKNGMPSARIRFQAYRSGGGRYSPQQSRMEWVMTCEPASASAYELNKVGLHVEVCTTHRINPAPQSSFKTNNSLPYIMGGLYVAQQALDDCFLLDGNGNIAEATSSNVFLQKGSELLTPDLRAGGVPGVMRTVVMEEAKKLGFTVSEKPISVQDLNLADECFLTNASRGVQWVGAVGKKRYFKRFASKLVNSINAAYGLG